MAGRKPIPTAIKILHGNPGHRPLNKNEPKFTGTVTCPTWLPDIAKTEWKRIVDQLAELDMIKSTDQSALAAYCVSFARWVTAEKQVNKEGQTLKQPLTDKAGLPVLDPKGKVLYKIIRHPATIIAKDERTSMLKAASLFGFDPSSRSRVQVPETKETEPEDDSLASLYAAPEDSSGIVH